MSFPSNPTNGQTANINGVVYTYSNTLTAWQVTTTFSGNVTVDQLTGNAVVAVGNVSGGNLVAGSNVIGGNLSITTLATSATLSATGNVIGNNVNVSNLVSVTGQVAVSGNVTSPFYVSARTISSNVTLGNVNTMAVGPITIADGYTVTISNGGEWSIV